MQYDARSLEKKNIRRRREAVRLIIHGLVRTIAETNLDHIAGALADPGVMLDKARSPSQKPAMHAFLLTLRA